ncbi:MAG: DUF3459 domain-containing protein [Anaerolineales bacterium]|nr:DUF3459 domain-containing protein [Anaerolineales bacterium]
MKLPKSIVPLLLGMIVLYGCALPGPAQAPTSAPETPTQTVSPTSLPDTPMQTTTAIQVPEKPINIVLPSATITPTQSSANLLRIRLSTTSDWTELYLPADTPWRVEQVVSASEQATTAIVDGDHLVLDQPISRAENGESVEMTADVLFPSAQSGELLVFKITRGHIGSTEVEISRHLQGEWVVIRVLNWSGIITDGENALSVEIPVEELFGELLSLADRTQAKDGYGWWNECVFYEIFVRSFYDSNGDGHGDLNGVTQKLDYLNDGDPATTSDLGITGIWLRPITACTTYHCYDVTNYYTLNPQYGTMADLSSLLDAAHARGIHVIIDLVLNHTSSQNPWFVQAADPASPFHDWYIWSDADPGYPGSWGQDVWFPANGGYYYSTFTAGMPDLNYTNPAVTQEMYNIACFWLEEVGVDGFRLDAAKHIIEEGIIQANSAATHTWYEGFRPVYKAANPQALAVGEIWEQPDITAEYLQGDELDLAFDFYLAFAFIQAVSEGNASAANDQLRFAYTTQPAMRVAPFLTNFDLDRAMTQLGNDPAKVKAAASMMLTAPGVPFVYYGEEVGMQGEAYEGVRTPMQWSASPYAGFSTITPWTALASGWESFNVANEIDDQTSILAHYRALIQARNQHSALRLGNLSLVSTGNDALYAIWRESEEEAVLVLVNLSGEAVSDYALALGASSLDEGSHTPLVIIGEGPCAPLAIDPGGGFSEYVPLPEIPPYATLILGF